MAKNAPHMKFDPEEVTLSPPVPQRPAIITEAGYVAMLSPTGEQVWAPEDKWTILVDAGYVPQAPAAFRQEETLQRVGDDPLGNFAWNALNTYTFGAPSLLARAGAFGPSGAEAGALMAGWDAANPNAAVAGEVTGMALGLGAGAAKAIGQAAGKGAGRLAARILPSAIKPAGETILEEGIAKTFFRGIAESAAAKGLAGTTARAATEMGALQAGQAVTEVMKTPHEISAGEALKKIVREGIEGAATGAGLNLALAGIGAGLKKVASKTELAKWTQAADAEERRSAILSRVQSLRSEGAAYGAKAEESLGEWTAGAARRDSLVDLAKASQVSGKSMTGITGDMMAAEGAATADQLAPGIANYFKSRGLIKQADKLQEVAKKEDELLAKLFETEKKTGEAAAKEAMQHWVKKFVLNKTLALAGVAGFAGFGAGGPVGAAVGSLGAVFGPTIFRKVGEMYGAKVVRAGRALAQAGSTIYGTTKAGIAASQIDDMSLKQFRAISKGLASVNPATIAINAHRALDGIASQEEMQAVAAESARAFLVLNEELPKPPPNDNPIPVINRDWQPTAQQLREFSRAYRAVMFPSSLLDDMRSGNLSPAAVSVAEKAHPRAVGELRNLLQAETEKQIAQGRKFTFKEQEQISIMLGMRPSNLNGPDVSAMRAIKIAPAPKAKAPKKAAGMMATRLNLLGMQGAKL